MKRLLLALVLVIAGAAIFLGPPLRSAFADTEVEITLGRAPMHPTQQALNFMLDAPEEAALPAKKKMKLWATYYHMPTVRPYRCRPFSYTHHELPTNLPLLVRVSSCRSQQTDT